MLLTGIGGLCGILFSSLIVAGLNKLMPSLPASTPLWGQMAGFCGSVGRTALR